MISVPKRRLRHAVDRVLMRRRIREAFRLLKPAPGAARPTRDIAFVYVASKPLAYSAVRYAVDKLLRKILISSGTERPSSSEEVEESCAQSRDIKGQ